MPSIRTDEVQMSDTDDVQKTANGTLEVLKVGRSISTRSPRRWMFRSLLDEFSHSFSTSSIASDRKGRSKHCCCRSMCGMRSCLCCSPACALVSLPAAFIFFLIVFGIGSAVERGHVVSAEPTGWVYETPEVCSVSNRTYADVGAAHTDGEDVTHCGACGQCSNAHDIQIYFDTLETLTDTSTTCAVKAVLQGESAVTSCFDNRVNLTRGCMPHTLELDPSTRRSACCSASARSATHTFTRRAGTGTTCWVENVMCDLRNCVFTCLLYRMGFSGGGKNSGDELSHCLECDEKRCGPAFIRCAGANRRRSGIYSDIERNCSHVCKVIDSGPGADPSEAQQACEADPDR